MTVTQIAPPPPFSLMRRFFCVHSRQSAAHWGNCWVFIYIVFYIQYIYDLALKIDWILWSTLLPCLDKCYTDTIIIISIIISIIITLWNVSIFFPFVDDLSYSKNKSQPTSVFSPSLPRDLLRNDLLCSSRSYKTDVGGAFMPSKIKHFMNVKLELGRRESNRLCGHGEFLCSIFIWQSRRFMGSRRNPASDFQ